MRAFLVAVGCALFCAGLFSGCGGGRKDLPRLGEVQTRTVDGKTVHDTLFFEIPEFRFVDQDSQTVSLQTVAGKIYIADFFFTHCPTICPKVKQQMMRVYETFLEEPRFVMLSHSIDTRYDTVAQLRRYAEKMGIRSDKWHLLTGDHDEIYEIANQYYKVSAVVDSTAPGGFDHDGKILLIDPERHIRGFYDGTDPEAVDRMMEDIRFLLEQFR
jgi:protein SCO1/2